MVKNLPANAGDTGDLGSVPGLGRSPGGGNGNPPPVFLLGKSNGQRRLVSYSPQGCKELDGTHSGREAHWYSFSTRLSSQLECAC